MRGLNHTTIVVFLTKVNILKLPFCLLIISLFFYTTTNAQKPAYFQQKVNFDIKVKLNDKDKTIDAYEEIEYINNSPDTLKFIWFHLWPNAYKNDRTAFSEQFLKNGRNDFYFSKETQRGYINQLDFKIDGLSAKTEDSSLIDITKLILNFPLLPGDSIKISTPFHEKLPYNFSRGGYVGNSFQLTQWFPKPAVYDYSGWHPMPYLDQGEFFSEFGNYKVSITVPQNYIIAATGILQDKSEQDFVQKLTTKNYIDSLLNIKQIQASRYGKPVTIASSQNIPLKTLHFYQENVHDFAWFANRRFLIKHDTMQMASGRIINLWVYHNKADRKIWEHSIDYIKKTIASRNNWLGEYPYDVVSVVEANIGFSGGMEYPTITSVSPMPTPRLLETLIEHEVGHNWNYAILGSNEREHPWLDEGINSFFDRRYERETSPAPPDKLLKADIINNHLPLDLEDFFYRSAVETKKDQPIETPSRNFSELNYNVIAYHKSALWLELIEKTIGRKVMDSVMHTYYEAWKFKHPYPNDFKNILSLKSGSNLDSIYNLKNNRGPLLTPKRNFKILPIISFRHTDWYNYSFISPAVGYNFYDGPMLGVAIHNFTLPANKFQYFIAPLYGTKSKELNGISRFQYHWNSYGKIQQTLISFTADKFTMNHFIDSTGKINYLSFTKLVPSIRIFFKEKDPRSTITKFLQFKTFFINEKNLLFSRDTVNQKDIISYPNKSYYINQLRFVVDDHCSLYLYRIELQTEQAADFAKVSLTANYLFNYANGGGLSARFFAGKFLYLGDKTIKKQFGTQRFQLNMTGPNGYEDYTYSNYFIGRNDFKNYPSQQIMIRDGGFKVRSELLSAKIGKTDNWLTAINLQSDIPKNINPLEILPIKIPVKVFFDLGTNGDAFKSNATGTKFLYDAGLQLSLVRNLINIYVPLAYSKVYADYYNSTFTDHKFLKKISFSIDLQNFNLRKFNPQYLL